MKLFLKSRHFFEYIRQYFMLYAEKFVTPSDVQDEEILITR